jgi:hypothetical protein
MGHGVVEVVAAVLTTLQPQVALERQVKETMAVLEVLLQLLVGVVGEQVQ